MHRVNPGIAGAVAILAAALTGGCSHSAADPASPPAMPQKCTSTGPVVFAVSGRQDSPAPVLTGAMSAALWAAVHDGSPVGLVDLDGKPHLTVAARFTDPGVNSQARQNDQQNYFGELAGAVQHTRARSAHADVLDALEVAGQAVRAGCGHGGTVYIEDSGLQETGPVNFRQPGMLAASPADVVAFLAKEHELPSLRGIRVVLVGFGDTAAPQHQLSIAQQRDVQAIWAAIARAGGATAATAPTPQTGVSAPRHAPPVLLVPVPGEPAWRGSDGSFVFPDSGPVGFKPNEAVFRDRPAAIAALRPIARYLTATKAARIQLTGTTAHWGPLAGAIRLSLRRAAAVKTVLRQLGASASQITVRGVAWHFAGYENDQGPDGTLLPGPAEHNRSVIVTKR